MINFVLSWSTNFANLNASSFSTYYGTTSGDTVSVSGSTGGLVYNTYGGSDSVVGSTANENIIVILGASDVVTVDAGTNDSDADTLTMTTNLFDKIYLNVNTSGKIFIHSSLSGADTAKYGTVENVEVVGTDT